MAQGTLGGRVLVRLTIASGATSASAMVTLYRPGGEIFARSSGRAERNGGARINFSGSMTVTGGSGEYGQAQGSGTLSGTLYRRNDSMTVEQEGTLSY